MLSANDVHVHTRQPSSELDCLTYLSMKEVELNGIDNKHVHTHESTSTHTMFDLRTQDPTDPTHS